MLDLGFLLCDHLLRVVLVSFQIVLWGRTEKCLKETTEEIRQMGAECHYFICDVGNREEVYQTAKAVREKVSALLGSEGSAGPRTHPAAATEGAWLVALRRAPVQTLAQS